MIQGGSETRFALESLDAIGIGGQVMPQHLDRHDAPKPPVARAVDLAHAAGAERLEDFVRSEARAGVKCHGSRRKGTRPPEPKSKNQGVSRSTNLRKGTLDVSPGASGSADDARVMLAEDEQTVSFAGVLLASLPQDR
jgi:hypothetical protein